MDREGAVCTPPNKTRSFLHYETYSQTFSGMFILRSFIATHRVSTTIFSKWPTAQNSSVPQNPQQVTAMFRAHLQRWMPAEGR